MSLYSYIALYSKLVHVRRICDSRPSFRFPFVCVRACVRAWPLASTPRRVPTWAGQGHVWLAGDNRENSEDSRSYGSVPQALVEGIVSVRLWPYRDFGVVE